MRGGRNRTPRILRSEGKPQGCDGKTVFVGQRQTVFLAENQADPLVDIQKSDAKAVWLSDFLPKLVQKVFLKLRAFVADLDAENSVKSTYVKGRKVF